MPEYGRWCQVFTFRFVLCFFASSVVSVAVILLYMIYIDKYVGTIYCIRWNKQFLLYSWARKIFKSNKKVNLTPKTKTTFLSDTKIAILEILGRQNFNNFVSGGIYLQPQVLMVPKMKSMSFCILMRTGGKLMKRNLHLTGQLISWRPTNQWTRSNIH